MPHWASSLERASIVRFGRYCLAFPFSPFPARNPCHRAAVQGHSSVLGKTELPDFETGFVLDVFEVLKAFGLDPARVKFERVSGTRSTPSFWHITVPSTAYFFRFTERHTGEKVADFSPGHEKIREVIGVGSWPQYIHWLTEWCQLFHREMGALADDPWAELERQKVPFTLDQNDEAANSPFTVREFEKVERTIKTLEGLMLAYAKDNEDQQKAIRGELRQLLEAAKTADRKQWFYLAVGFIASTAVSLALAPDQTKALYEALKAGLGSAVKLIAA